MAYLQGPGHDNRGGFWCRNLRWCGQLPHPDRCRLLWSCLYHVYPVRSLRHLRSPRLASLFFKFPYHLLYDGIDWDFSPCRRWNCHSSSGWRLVFRLRWHLLFLLFSGRLGRSRLIQFHGHFRWCCLLSPSGSARNLP